MGKGKSRLHLQTAVANGLTVAHRLYKRGDCMLRGFLAYTKTLSIAERKINGGWL